MNPDIPREPDHKKLERRNRELSILHTIAAALNSEVDLEQALKATLAQVADLFDLETGWVWLINPEDDLSYLAASQNLPPALGKHPERMEGPCYCLDTFRTGDLDGAANVNVVTCSRLKWLQDETFGLRYHASIPLYTQEKKLGVMNVASTDWRELSADDLKLLHTVGDLLSIAIERARLFGKSVELGIVEERNRLAREIHDTLAQGLSAIALKLETAEAILDQDQAPNQVRRTIKQALDLSRINLEEARRSVLDLRAAPLEGKSLPEAIKTLVQRTEASEKITIDLQIQGRGRPLPVTVETGLFRILQEGLTNIIHHAEANEIQITLAITQGAVVLKIRDDGRGFSVEELPPGSFGLTGINERAHLLGGQMEIITAPGAGTTLQVTVPMEAL